MSVAILIIKTQIESPYKLIPVATEAFFYEFWYPLAQEHRLQNIIDMSGFGYPFNHDQLQAIINDFEQVRQIVAADVVLSKSTWLLNRIADIITNLEIYLPDETFEGWVG